MNNQPIYNTQQEAYFGSTRNKYSVPPAKDIETGHAIPVAAPVDSSSVSFAHFVNKTLNYVSMQIVLTMMISFWMYINRSDVIHAVSTNGLYLWGPIIMTFISLFGLFKSDRGSCWQTTWFWTFTVSCGCMIGISVLSYAPDVVMKAVATTGVIVIGINAYSYYCAKNDRNFDFLEPILGSGLIALILVGVLNIFIKSNLLGSIITLFGILIFVGFLLFDLNHLYTKNKDDEDYMADPMMSAVGIYLDIVNLFLYILDAYDKCQKNEC